MWSSGNNPTSHGDPEDFNQSSWGWRNVISRRKLIFNKQSIEFNVNSILDKPITHGIFPLCQFPLCEFSLRQFPFGQLPTLSIPTLSIPIWSMLMNWELTKWELTKWEVDKVRCCLCELDVGMRLHDCVMDVLAIIHTVCMLKS